MAPPKKAPDSKPDGKKKDPPPTQGTGKKSNLPERRKLPGGAIADAENKPISTNELVGGKSWTGKLPVTLLNEHCQKQGWLKPDYGVRKESHGQFLGNVTLYCVNPKTREREEVFLRPPVVKPDNSPLLVRANTPVEARHIAATYALHRICNMKNTHMMLPPTHRKLWGELEDIRKDEVKRGLSWRYEADPFAANRERSAAAAAMAQKQMIIKNKADSSSGSENNKQVLDSMRGWGNRVPIVDMEEGFRREVEGMIRKYHVWNPQGRLLTDQEKARIRAEMMRLGFRESHASEATDWVKDEQEALEWLLIHVPEDDTPSKFLPEGYKAGITMRSGGGLQQEYIARRLASAGYSMDLCQEVLKANGGSEARAAEALMQILVFGQQLSPKGDLIEEDLIKFDDPQEEMWDEEMWDEEMSSLDAIWGEERFNLVSKEIAHILIELPDYLEIPKNLLPPKIKLEVRKPTHYSGCERYPDALPTFTIITDGEPKLPAHVKLSIIRKTAEFAQTMIGEQMIFTVVDWLANEIVEMVKTPGLLRDVASAVTGSDETHEAPDAHKSQRLKQMRRGRRGPINWKPGSEKSLRLLEEAEARLKDPRQIKMLKARQNLPAWQKRDEIVNAVNSSQVVIISGETGSGKSTQSIQFILDDMILRQLGEAVNIICTQPRRISALGLAERVSEERCSQVGREIGYAIRGESRQLGGITKATFVTTGVLLRRLQMGDTLEDVSHIFIDEVHERSLDTDFLLILVKRMLAKRRDLKVILMSATLDAGTFAEYFGGPEHVKLVHIEGRTFPVTDYYLNDVIRMTGFTAGGRIVTQAAPGYVNDTEEDPTVEAVIRSFGDRINYNLIAVTIMKIDKDLGEQDGAVLIFLPGTMEIQRCIELLRQSPAASKLHLLPLHASLPPSEQRKVFEAPPPGKRKIIAATNVAETSITIEDVVCVIDTGKVKETSYDASTSVVKLAETWVSLAAAKQRRGRAGRVRAGHCYKLYTRQQENKSMPPRPEPELRRVPLEQTCLSVKAMGISDVRSFLQAAISPPSLPAVENAIKMLYDMGAVVDNELTALGKHMSMIPADLRLAKLMIYGVLFGCLDSALTIAAVLSTRSPFFSPQNLREQSRATRKSFAPGEAGDVIADCRAWEEWDANGRKMDHSTRRRWCESNYLDHRTLLDIASNRSQFLSSLRETGFIPLIAGNGGLPPQLSKETHNDSLLRAIIAGAFTPQLTRIQLPDQKFAATNQGALAVDPEARTIKYFTLDGRVFLHPSSTLFSAQSFPGDAGFMAYFNKMQTGKVFIRECTPVNAYAVLLLGGKVEVDMMGRGITVDGWIRLRAWGRIAVLVMRLRSMMDEALERLIDHPEEVLNGTEGAREVVETVKKLVIGGGV